MSSGFNVTAFPEIFGNLLGLEVEPMGVLLTIAVVIAISLTLATLELDIIGIGIVDICVLAFATYMGWFPIWITIIISLFVAVLTARKTVGILGGSGI